MLPNICGPKKKAQWKSETPGTERVIPTFMKCSLEPLSDVSSGLKYIFDMKG